MSGAMTLVPSDHPLMVAWAAYKATPEYENALRWAKVEEYAEGSVWSGFMAGWSAQEKEAIAARLRTAWTESDSNLVLHARTELQRAELFDADADYGGATAHAVMELVEVFSKQGHSGMSAWLVINILPKLLNFKTLTPPTSDPAEWMEVQDDLWQNRRSCSLFSNNGGRTWWDIDNPTRWERFRRWLGRLQYRMTGFA